jgi:hypothetical protein
MVIICNIDPQDVLTSDDVERSPIIFLRDVAFAELQALMQFIYFGRTVVQGDFLKGFFSLLLRFLFPIVLSRSPPSSPG